MSTKTHKGLHFNLLYPHPTIHADILRLASEVNSYYQKVKNQDGQLDLVVVCLLKGAFMFYSDLVKEIVHPHTNQFVKVKSYTGLNAGQLTVETDIRPETYAGKSVLVVDDMHDTGHTLKQFIELLNAFKSRRVDTAVLIRRPDRPVEIDLKFCGLTCDDFIVGYGLDFDEFGRHYPEIYQKTG